MSLQELKFASISELASLIKSQDISPVEIAQNTLDRISALDGNINAFLAVFDETVIRDAQVAESEIVRGMYRGPLHGVPVGLKDLIDVAGKVTTAGSTILAKNMAKNDAKVTCLLRDAGATIIGKLGCVEFALGGTGLNPHYGNTRNPWDHERITGGSSTGSAASVAAGLLPGTLGSDTGGSIRMPASICGIAGLKPTYGRISRSGVLDLSWSMDTIGPMTGRVEACALMLNSLAGYDPSDPASSTESVPDFTSRLNIGLEEIRIGIPSHYFFDDIYPPINQAVTSALELMERNGATLVTLHMPWAGLGRSINTAITLPEATVVHEQWINESAGSYSPEVRSRIQSAFDVTAADYIRSQRARSWFSNQVATAMSNVDVLITPTIPIKTPTIEACTPSPGANEGTEGRNIADFTGVFNTTGQPSLSIPCGFDPDGMPIGMMVTGKPFDEVTVLQVGNAYENLAGWYDHHPTT